jgi:uncharacterized protein involved in outer membrane biogenesis
MRTVLTILAIAGGIVVVVLLGVAIAVSTVDPKTLIGPVQAEIKAATGREVAINGGVDLKLGLEPKLVADDVRIGNAPWAKTPDLLTAKKIEAVVGLLPLLKRRFELVRLNLIEPVITLETNAEGKGNWEWSPPAGAATAAPPNTNAAALAVGVGDIEVTRGTLTYRDGATGTETHVAIDDLSIHARDPNQPINAAFRGTIDGVAVALTGNLGPLATLAERRLPYPVMLQGDINGRKSALVAKVQRVDRGVELQDIDLTTGDTRAKGRVGISEAGPRTSLTIDLDLPTLALTDLALAAAAPVKTTAGAATPAQAAHYLFPDVPVPLEGLAKRDAEGTIAIGSLALPSGRSVTNIRTRFTLKNGKLDVPSIEATTLGGSVTGALAIDAVQGQVPTIKLTLNAHGVDLSALLATTGVKREVHGGKSEVAIDVAMRGNSPHQWTSGINGRANLSVGPASLVNSKVDATMALDRLAQAVNPFRTTEPMTELRCAVIRLPLTDGVAHVERTIGIETRELDVSASGTLDFRSETLDLAVTPRVRQGISVDITHVSDFVRFRGPFASPAVVIDPGAAAALVARIGAAVGTSGLSVVGEALLTHGGGPGACDVALGKAAAQGASASNTEKHGGPATALGEVGKALGQLLQR